MYTNLYLPKKYFDGAYNFSLQKTTQNPRDKLPNRWVTLTE